MSSRLDLLPAIALHIALGATLLAVLWSAGTGYVLLAVRGRSLDAAPLLALGYAAGLVAASVAAVLVLAHPLGAVPAVALLAFGIVPLARDERVRPLLRAPLGGAALASPFVVLAATLLGLVYHGPTNERGSSQGGDMLLYVAKLASARDSIFPFRDLLVSGQHFTFTEGAPTFLGAAVSWLPGYDPFLVDAVTLPTLLLLALAAGVGSLALAHSARPLLPRSVSIAIAVVGASAVVYPSWIVESPPVALALPLAFAVFWLSRMPLALSALVLAAAVIAVGLALTKVIALLFLAVIVGARLVARDLQPEPRRRSLIAIAAVSVLGVTCVVVAAFDSGGFFALLSNLMFAPATAVREASNELHTGLHIPWSLLTVAGQVLAVAVLVRSRLLALATALGVAVIENWIEQGVVDITGVGFGLLCIVCVYLLDPAEAVRRRLLLAATGGSLALAAVGREFTGTYVGPLLMLSVAAAFLAASREGLRLAPARALAADLPLFLGFVTAAAVWLGGRHAALVAVVWALLALAWAGARRAGGRAPSVLAVVVVAASLAYAAARATLPPETNRVTSTEHELWHAVHRVVPAGALVFTSLTGESVTEQTGWNYYPAVAVRQLYIAGWADSELQAAGARDRLRARLDANAGVLAGRLAPADAPHGSGFGSYYAAVAAGARVPAGFTHVTTVGPYALYRIG